MKLSLIALFGFVLGLFVIAPSRAVSQEPNASSSSKLEVRVNYTGAGTVDEKHKIYVALWNTPDFVNGEGSMPVSMQPAASKTGTVTFDQVKDTPVYVSAVFDPTGSWDAQSAPPEGSSLGLYAKAAGKPEPIEMKGTQPKSVELAFDDSVKMRSGKASR